MSSISRREFFARFADEVSERVTPVLRQLTPVIPSAPLAGGKADGEIFLGRIAEFAPGAKKTIRFQDGSTIEVRSYAEGIAAEHRSQNGQVSLLITQKLGGLLFADKNRNWPSDQVLSHITGEPVRLTDPGEIQNEQQ